MERKCSKCGKLLGYRKPLLKNTITHGLCRPCIKEGFPEIYNEFIIKNKPVSNCIYEQCYYRTLGKELGKQCPSNMKADDCAMHWNFMRAEEQKEKDELV